jgi:hypothetical protein
VTSHEASSLSGMPVMYLLMSAFHAGSWLRLISRGQSGTRWSRIRMPRTIWIQPCRRREDAAPPLIVRRFPEVVPKTDCENPMLLREGRHSRSPDAEIAERAVN